MSTVSARFDPPFADSVKASLLGVPGDCGFGEKIGLKPLVYKGFTVSATPFADSVTPAPRFHRIRKIDSYTGGTTE